jgi:DNA-binding NtrC family response regulator
VARVRAQVWHAIFTRDLRRYIRVLFERMARIPLLVTGPTGTGKEMVARAVAGSSYIPFDERAGRFLCDPRSAYHPHNISEKAETLVESELFGHVKGAFTGATADREGILSRCGAHGTFFLDEVGELVPEIQVKLLRVLQERTFQRVGDPRPTPFLGKIVAATNRDLPREIEEGTFRRDLYYRLKGNRIATPTLREILEDSPGDRRVLVHHIAEKLAGPEEADSVTEDVEAFLDAELPGYPWPGNVRELEDCVESILVEGTYTPDHEPAAPSQSDPVFDDDVRRGRLDDDQMSRRYATHVRALAGTNREAARWLKINVRTLRERLDHALLARLLERMGKKGDDGDGDE